MNTQSVVRWSIVVFAIIGIYFFTRLIAIRTFPPFNDEFIYVRWAQQGYFDPSARLLSLSDGKQPLYIWLISLMMNIIPSPLAAGRVVSILSGAGTMVGLGVLSWFLFKNPLISIVASVLYVFYPLALLLDRFALYDSLLAFLSVWCMVIMYRLVQKPTLGTSLILAFFLGAALLTKSSSVLLFLTLPLTVIFFAKSNKKKLTASMYFIVTLIIAGLYQSVQQLSIESLAVDNKNALFVYTWEQLRTVPLVSHITRNFIQYSSWIGFYISLPLVVLSTAVACMDRRNRKAYMFLLLSFLLPFCVIVVVGKLIYSRHLFFLTMPILVLSAAAVAHFLRKIQKLWLQVIFLIICFLPILYIQINMLSNFKMVSLPAIDRFQYIDGWPAGWGVKDIVHYLQSESTKGDLTVLTEGVFGSLPTTAMRLYFSNYPQIHIIPIDDEKAVALPKDVDWQYPVYLILNKSQTIPKDWNAQEILKVQKGMGQSYIRLLRLWPSSH